MRVLPNYPSRVTLPPPVVTANRQQVIAATMEHITNGPATNGPVTNLSAFEAMIPGTWYVNFRDNRGAHRAYVTAATTGGTVSVSRVLL